MNEETKDLVPASTKDIQLDVGPAGGLIPTDFKTMWKLASVIHASRMAPEDLDSPEKILVAMQFGAEVGLKPMQAIQNVAVINKRPAMWGDAALGLCYASGQLEEFEEWSEGTPFTDGWVYHCKVKRRGYKMRQGSWTWKQAKQAGFDKVHQLSPWARFPERMMQMRARSWAIRDSFADVLKGLRIAEEYIDVPVDITQPLDESGVVTEPTEEPETEEQVGKDEEKEGPPEDRFRAIVDSGQVTPDELDKFLAHCIKITEAPLEVIKAKATEDNEQWARFLADFGKWKAEQKDEPPEPPPAEKLPCPWPDCDFEAKSDRGLAKHNTQQHDGKEPPEAVEPGLDATEPGKEEEQAGAETDPLAKVNGLWEGDEFPSAKQKKFMDRMKGFAKLLGPVTYYQILGSHGFEKAAEVEDFKTMVTIFQEMLEAQRKKQDDEIPF
jgi:hypothetical protein